MNHRQDARYETNNHELLEARNKVRELETILDLAERDNEGNESAAAALRERVLMVDAERDKLAQKLERVRAITNTYGNTEDKLRAIEKVVHE